MNQKGNGSSAKTVTYGYGYSAEELAQFKLPGYPVSRKGWYDRARREHWEVREEPGKGPGGIRQTFVPPPEVQTLIDARQRGDTLPPAERPRLTRAELASLSKEVFGDAPARHDQNPNAQFEAMLKRVSEATQATVRISKQFDFVLPVEWTSLIQELMAMHGLTEAGAIRVIAALIDVKKAT